VHPDWKRRVVDAQALDAVKVVNDDSIMPPYSRPGVRSQARALETPLITALREHPDAVDPAVAGPTLIAAIRAGRGDQFLPFAGQSAALVHEILPAAEILRRTVSDAELALHRALGTTDRTSRLDIV
jgi:nitronate monooxygenase/enoyl-[acyl-carrier protein] reductase II